jgi:hypothetical protein
MTGGVSWGWVSDVQIIEYVVAGVPFCFLGGGGLVVAVCSCGLQLAVGNLLLNYCLQIRLD